MNYTPATIANAAYEIDALRARFDRLTAKGEAIAAKHGTESSQWAHHCYDVRNLRELIYAAEAYLAAA